MAAAAVGMTLALLAAVLVVHGRHWFVRLGFSELAAIALGVSEILAGLLFAWPRARGVGALALMAVLGWAAGFHFALRQPAAGLYGWMAAVAVIWAAGRLGEPAEAR